VWSVQARVVVPPARPLNGVALSALGNERTMMPHSTTRTCVAGDSLPVVLIADDNAEARELLLEFVESMPATGITARDGIETIEAIQRQRPDLIILDVMMPRLSGFQVCRELKGAPATRQIPILMLTALSAEQDAETARQLGADVFLSKPISRPDLLAHTKRLLSDDTRGRHGGG
jgi:two-component system, OmpR family, alkaline phosphatase synthesis response regulator PhoP